MTKGKCIISFKYSLLQHTQKNNNTITFIFSLCE